MERAPGQAQALSNTAGGTSAEHPTRPTQSTPHRATACSLLLSPPLPVSFSLSLPPSPSLSSAPTPPVTASLRVTAGSRPTESIILHCAPHERSDAARDACEPRIPPKVFSRGFSAIILARSGLTAGDWPDHGTRKGMWLCRVRAGQWQCAAVSGECALSAVTPQEGANADFEAGRAERGGVRASERARARARERERARAKQAKQGGRTRWRRGSR